LAEINFERRPLFRPVLPDTNDPATILGELSLALDREISPERSLLSSTRSGGQLVFSKLRWFYREGPLPPGGVPLGSLNRE